MLIPVLREKPRFSFGRFRLWSSVGYASLSLLAGYLVRQGTEVIFKVSAGLFLLLILLFGMAIAPLQQFIILDIGASDSFIGWVFFVQAIPEIPAYFIVAKVVKRTGPEKVILFAMAVSMLRMLCYGLITNPAIAIFFSILHCITIAVFLVGVVEYVQDRTPAHLRTTGQSLIWAFHFGAGLTLGNISLGYLRDQVGMNGAMLVHAALALLILGACAIFFRKAFRSFRKYPGQRVQNHISQGQPGPACADGHQVH